MSHNKPPPYGSAPPQPGFVPPASHHQHYQQQQQQQPPPTVIVQHLQQTSVPLGSDPSRVTCPSCHAQILTTVRSEATTRTHVIALLLCLFICWPCVCLPYCMDSCQNANHYCPNCKAYIGSYSN